MLFGMGGLEATEAERGDDGRLVVGARITLPAACPACGTVSGTVHQYVTARPRDVRACGEETDFFLVKRRLECPDAACPRQTFTESAPQVPPRCTITRRLLERAAAEVADRGSPRPRPPGTPAFGAFRARRVHRGRRRVLSENPAPVPHLGIDEHRRGRPRWRTDTLTGENVQLADRWHVCFYDLDGNQGLLGQVEGRTSDDAAYWLAGATPAWRHAVQVVAIDMCTIFASAVRRMLPEQPSPWTSSTSSSSPSRPRATCGAAPSGSSRPPRQGRRPRVRHQSLLNRNLENLSPGTIREGHRDPRRHRARPADRHRLDREGKAPRRPEAPRPGHPQHPLRTAGPRPALRLLRLVRAARARPRAPDSREHHRTLGKRDRHRRRNRRHQRHRREPQPPRQARGPPRLRLPQPANQRRRVRIACTRGTRRQSAGNSTTR